MSSFAKKHLFTENDRHLFEIQNIFATTSLWLKHGMDKQIATFDIVVRDMPLHRNFLLFGGLEEIVDGILGWHYSKKDIDYLKYLKLIDVPTEKYLSNFKFTGDVWAMPEGTPFFNGEPVIRITAPLLEANLISMFLLNTPIAHTLFLSKIIRVVLAVKDKVLVTGCGLRSQSYESGIKAYRSAHIVGAKSAIVSAHRKYNLPPEGISINTYHAVIKSFPDELTAFRAAAEMFPNSARLMVDTYDFEQGLKNVVRISKELKKKGNTIAGITIDSGDLYERSCRARKVFDEADLSHIKITAASNLDEYKIKELVDRKAPIDIFLVATEINSLSDSPKLEVVYKLCELKDKMKTRYTAKYAKGKESYPGKKQVFRQINKEGKMIGDIVGLEDESLGTPLLQQFISGGKLCRKMPSLKEISDFTKKEVGNLPENLYSLDNTSPYPVSISQKLSKLFESTKKEHQTKS